MNLLTEKLIARICARGPMPFREFMQSALYDAELGYYCTPGDKIGRRGDYYTSANVDEAFGALLAKQSVQLQQELGLSQLTIVEVGAGTGQLAADILTALQLEHHYPRDQIKYLICEASSVMQAAQQQRLADFTDIVGWTNYQALANAPIEGVIISNEVADALPVDRIRWQAGELYQLYLTEVAGRLEEYWQPAEPVLRDYLARLEVELIEHQIVEVGLAAIDWLASLAAGLQRGFIITIDYGDLADHLYAPETLSGTLRCFFRHHLTTDPYERIGEQDITADVNFSALIEYGRDFGLEPVELQRQADYLIRLGLLDRLEELVKRGEDFHSLKKRLALKNFFVPGGISDHFKVLVQKKLVNSSAAS